MNAYDHTTKRTQRRAALAAAAVAVLAGSAWAADTDAFAHLPPTLVVTATIRDFKAYNQTGGHADFQRYSGSTTVGLVKNVLDANGKPEPLSLRGQLISTEYKDSAGRNIMPALFDASLGDRQGVLAAGGTGNGIYSFDSFRQWFNDTSGVNASMQVPLTLKRVVNTNRYVFDSAVDEPYKTRGGFFPINGELFGNYANNNLGISSNFHFTTEVETEFVFTRGQNQVFKFTGDDDVWVFIDGKMVIDLGGLHAKKEQIIDLDRLSWLQSGLVYKLKVFHAERRTTESNFRVETTIQLRNVQPPSITALYD